MCVGCQEGEGNSAGNKGAPLGTHAAQWTPPRPGPPTPTTARESASQANSTSTGVDAGSTLQAGHPQRPGHGGTGGPLGSLALGGARDTGEGPIHSTHLRRPARWTRLPSAGGRDWCQCPAPPPPRPRRDHDPGHSRKWLRKDSTCTLRSGQREAAPVLRDQGRSDVRVRAHTGSAGELTGASGPSRSARRRGPRRACCACSTACRDRSRSRRGTSSACPAARASCSSRR